MQRIKSKRRSDDRISSGTKHRNLKNKSAGYKAEKRDEDMLKRYRRIDDHEVENLESREKVKLIANFGQ
jgi:hypothetical protein